VFFFEKKIIQENDDELSWVQRPTRHTVRHFGND